MAGNTNDDNLVSSNGSLISTTTNTRKNRPLRRKTSHSVIERRRREKINEGLISLQHLVPACRDELHELLLSKAQNNKRNSKRSKEEIEKEVEKLLLEKVESQMVLEKLCIISHTVDYVRELQASLAAYRKMCRCSPTLNELETAAGQEGFKVAKTHGQAHALDAEGEDGTMIKTTHDQYNHIEGSESSPEAEDDCIKCTISRAKRKRHWGSNNPLELAKVRMHVEKYTRPHPKSSSVQSTRQQRPRRKAAPSAQTMREESIESTDSGSDDRQILKSNRQEQEISLQEENRMMDEESDNGSELALDDWKERRQSQTDNGPVTPPFSTSMPYLHLYHTCSLRDENPDRKSIGSRKERSFYDPQSIKSGLDRQVGSKKILANPFPKSSSDGEQITGIRSPAFNRKRRATDVMSFNHDGYGRVLKEAKKDILSDSNTSPLPEETPEQKESCMDCAKQSNPPIITQFGPDHYDPVRAASPSDRLLHHTAKANRLDVLANVITRK